MILNVPEFIAKAESRGVDPFPLIERFGRELAKLTVDDRQELFSRALRIRREKMAATDEEPFYPCGWCRQSNWDPYCGWWHWWICDWPGFDCIDCGGEPPPE